jgi:hypothetical protein
MRLRGLAACGTIDLSRGHIREERLAPRHRSLIRSSGRSLTRSTTPCAWNRVNTTWGPILLGWTNVDVLPDQGGVPTSPIALADEQMANAPANQGSRCNSYNTGGGDETRTLIRLAVSHFAYASQNLDTNCGLLAMVSTWVVLIAPAVDCLTGAHTSSQSAL